MCLSDLVSSIEKFASCAFQTISVHCNCPISLVSTAFALAFVGLLCKIYLVKMLKIRSKGAKDASYGKELAGVEHVPVVDYGESQSHVDVSFFV